MSSESPFYLHQLIHSLPHVIGENQPDGTRLLEGNKGIGSYGPYCQLAPGSYFGGFHIQRLDVLDVEGTLLIDVTSGSGMHVLEQKLFGSSEICHDVAGLYGVEFLVDRHVTNVEVRITFNGKGMFSIKDLVLFSLIS